MVHDSSCLLLEAKYGSWRHLEEELYKTGGLTTWRSMKQAMKQFRRGLVWTVHDGSIAKFWTTIWLIPQTLQAVVVQPISAEHLSKLVGEYWALGTGWQLQVPEILLFGCW